MSDTSIGPDKRVPSTSQCSKAKPGRTVKALKTHDAAFQMSKVRRELLQQMIFARVTGPEAAWKLYVAYRRLLDFDDAVFILGVIWKEFIAEEDLSLAGLGRSFPNSPMTQHGLAVALAKLPKEVSAMNSHVRNLSIAAEAYGLITRQMVTPTKVVIEATELLHSFMIELHCLYEGVLRGAWPPVQAEVDDLQPTTGKSS